MLKYQRLLKLFLSILGLYFLATSLDLEENLVVSTWFAVIVISAGEVVWDRAHLLRYAGYLCVANVTYYFLFKKQPWDFLSHGGSYDATILPVVVCSVGMTLAGWLLLKSRRRRFIYTVLTLGLQLPLAWMLGSDFVQVFLGHLSRSLHYQEYYAGSLQAWQFSWMLTYYLPFYIFSLLKKPVSVSDEDS